MKKRLILLAVILLLTACLRSPIPSSADEAPPIDPAPTTAVQPSEETSILVPDPVDSNDQPSEDTPAAESTTDSPPSEPAIQSSIEAILVSLEGLPLDDFFAESFAQLLLRSPEFLTEVGVAADFGIRNDQLDDLSEAFIRETQKLEASILELLHTYDRESMAPEQQISYDVYEWYLQNQVNGHVFTYHEYSLHHMIRSYHFNIDALFSEIQPLKSTDDVEDYINRLSQVLRQTEQLMLRLEAQEATGIIPPNFIIRLARSDLFEYLGLRSPDPSRLQAESLVMYTRLDQSLDGIPGINSEERNAIRAEALETINTSVIPAYVLMIDYLDRAEPLATEDAGVWKLPDGDAYYAYMLRRETSTDLTPEEIHELGLAEVERIQAEMHEALIEMGYPAHVPLDQILPQAVDDAGYYNIISQNGLADYVAEIERAIAVADEKVVGVFDLKPHYQVEVIAGEYGGYYVQGSADGSRLGSYHVSKRGQWRPKYSLYTVAYHETTPGHHYQIATAQRLDLPDFRNHLVFNAYAEGWALYAERLAWELGLYENNPFGNIGRLQYELLRAVRLVTDTGIHAMGWTRDEAIAYMDEATGLPGWFSHEVDRYVVLPAQATGYKIGMLKIMELRQKAEDALGDQFDLKEFHNVVIGNGSLPLEILEIVVEDWIEQR